jgi:hypothetical protein
MPAKIGPHLNVFAHSQIGNQVIHLKNIAQVFSPITGELLFLHRVHPLSADEYFAAVRCIDSPYNTEKGGFSGSRRSQKKAEFSFFNPQADPPQNLYVAVSFSERFSDVFQFQQQFSILQITSAGLSGISSPVRRIILPNYSVLVAINYYNAFSVICN